jgi:hypothetical protein
MKPTTYRGHRIELHTDLLGGPLFTAYRPSGSVLAQASSREAIAREIRRAAPDPIADQGWISFGDGAQLGPLFAGEEG